MSEITDEARASREIDAATAPWGIVIALAAVFLTVSVALVGGGVVYALAFRALRGQKLLGDVLSYRFLTAGVAVSAFLLILRRYRVGPPSLGYRFPGWRPLAIAAFSVLPVYAGVAILYAIFSMILPGYHLSGNAKDVFGVSTAGIGIPKLLLLLIFVGIEVPLTEETLFRGILFQGLRNTFARVAPYPWAVFLAALVSGSIFGLAHGEIHTLPILIFLGVVLAYLFQYSRSVYAPAVLHAMVNMSAAVAYLHH